MREIKCRGKRKSDDKWVYGYYVKTKEEKHLIVTSRFISYLPQRNIFGKVFSDYEVIPETVGQYIGIKDINKNEIYEGDIVKRKLNNKYKLYMIKFNTQGNGLGPDEGELSFTPGYYLYRNTWYVQLSRFEEVEIVGNIYNPELWEELW